MSRIRSIHPGFFTDDELVTVSPIARIFFLGLLVEADDKGAFRWKPLTLKMRILPADNVEIDELLAELCAIDCIRQYEIDGKLYGAIRNFTRFQRPKSPKNLHPIPDDFRNYLGLKSDDFPNRGSSSIPIGEGVPQKGEIAPQREEGGRRMKDEGGRKKNTKKKNPAEIIIPDGVSPEIWRDFQALRKKKGAPITPTVLKGFEREAAKAGWPLEKALTETVERGWQGFKADWVKEKQNGKSKFGDGFADAVINAASE